MAYEGLWESSRESTSLAEGRQEWGWGRCDQGVVWTLIGGPREAGGGDALGCVSEGSWGIGGDAL